MRCAMVLLALAVGAGCADSTEQLKTLNAAVIQRDDRIRILERDLTEAQKSHRDQAEQIRTLQALTPRRLEKLFPAAEIRIGRFTGAYNSDNGDGKDGVKVIVQPRDAYGSPIKAAGDVTITLFDLAAETEKIAEYRFGVEEIGTKWYSGALTYHFSFECPWPSRRPTAGEITVRVEFVDYLTGKTLTAQKAIEVTPPTEPQAHAVSADAKR